MTMLMQKSKQRKIKQQSTLKCQPQKKCIRFDDVSYHLLKSQNNRLIGVPKCRPFNNKLINHVLNQPYFMSTLQMSNPTRNA